MADIVELHPRSRTDEDGNGIGDVAAWLRAFADFLETGAHGEGVVKSAIVVFVVEEDGKICLRTRRCNMNLIEQIGALNVMHYDLLTSE